MVKFAGYVRFPLVGTLVLPQVISLAISLAIYLALGLSGVAQAQQNDLDVSIAPVENGVEFVLTNNTGSPISLLRWETPLESELTQDVFYITESDGGNRSVHSTPATFSGRLFKRPDPIPSDFIEIEAGQSVSAVVNLADYYQLAGEGSHQVSFHGEFQIQGQRSHWRNHWRRCAQKIGQRYHAITTIVIKVLILYTSAQSL